MKLEKVKNGNKEVDYLFVDPTTGTHYVRIRRKGKRPLFESLDTKNRRTALQLKDDKVREYLGHAPRKVLHNLFKDESEAFINWSGYKVKEKTRKRMRSVITHHLNPHWGMKFCGEVTPQSWIDYLDSQGERNCFNDWKAMNLVLKFAFQNKRLDIKPILHNPKELSTISKEFSDEEITAVMKASPEPLRLINYIALKIGARDDEILKLKWSDISYKLKQISLNGKTGPRISVAPDSLLELLKARQKTSVSKWVFPQITNPEKPLDNGTRHNYWDQARKLAGVEGRFHDFKHTAITRMLRAGMTVEWVSKQVGTSPEVIREVYDKLKIQEVPEIADAVTVEGESSFFEGGLGVDNGA